MVAAPTARGSDAQLIAEERNWKRNNQTTGTQRRQVFSKETKSKKLTCTMRTRKRQFFFGSHALTGRKLLHSVDCTYISFYLFFCEYLLLCTPQCTSRITFFLSLLLFFFCSDLLRVLTHRHTYTSKTTTNSKRNRHGDNRSVIGGSGEGHLVISMCHKDNLWGLQILLV